MYFEWQVTALFILLSMFAVYAFMRSLGVDSILAAVCALVFPFTGPIMSEYRHVTSMRGRLLFPLIMTALSLVSQRSNYLRWIFLAFATIFCIGQSLHLFWVGPMVVLWLSVLLIMRRNLLFYQIKTEKWLFRFH